LRIDHQSPAITTSRKTTLGVPMANVYCIEGRRKGREDQPAGHARFRDGTKFHYS